MLKHWRQSQVATARRATHSKNVCVKRKWVENINKVKIQQQSHRTAQKYFYIYTHTHTRHVRIYAGSKLTWTTQRTQGAGVKKLKAKESGRDRER